MTALDITEQQSGEVTILALNGNLRIGEESVTLRRVVRRLLAEGKQQVLLNFANVNYVDSSGLGELISSHVSLRKAGGQMKLLHLTLRVRDLMIITKLLTVFSVYDDEAEALESFKSSQDQLATALLATTTSIPSSS